MQNIILTLIPQSGEPLNTNMSTMFHGLLMEFADSEYAGLMHRQGLKPYSQYICRGKNKKEWHWHIKTLTDEAFNKLAAPLFHGTADCLELKKKNIALKIKKKELGERLTVEDLVQKFYINGNANRRIKIRFITPCAFKTSGRYEFFPHIPLIYQSLMNKFDCFSESVSVKDNDALRHLCENTRITDYRLKSSRFNLEGIKIPSFLGEIIFRIEGPETLVNLANLLIYYGLWAGLGIKTTLGMGGIDVE
ncbi:CRISPR-associated endoribonuclease Cas6 [Koleobacter methoxysyntrophicus]|uniref:CRISPR-associated endoribonuclease Cas6 n=1 Tax=Koleobacter methoxysyntrophicus TaxID=2751313 RepID=A0A8A0RJH1_9FIRM|nr:CRISPR system precrRNA processing endoribonuclease RAMP protein Cas6 [Koleobacter methoxysyntrophicus]QSQ08591.1 CRISPR-associated endoribonuclease Cas6 [Koleobacter methoxysyntrophicus]